MKLEKFDDIVISGVGGYFPKSANLDQFKQNLLSGEDLLEHRWQAESEVTNKLGCMPDVNRFDTAYFGIHRQQATFMDPMQRLVLERTFEALIDAGVNPTEVRGKKIGVYVGSSVGENDNLFYESIISGFGVTGHSRAMLTNRISYWLNLKGPSCSYDSNWMNGLEVLRLGYEAIKNGQVEAAIIGSANLCLNSELSWLYNDMGLLSSDGTTRAFDANAEGYGRSDGVVIMYLQRASDARRNYAKVINVGTEFNGNREGRLLDLDTQCITNFLHRFYSECSVDPRDVDFVETYGSGQKHIDKIELDALEPIYCKNRSSPLMVGSVKSNAGHSEASSALFGVAKALIALDSGVIPGNIHYSQPNPEISQLANGKMEVVAENRKFDGKYVAVNAFGIDSYYGHALFQINPKTKEEKKDDLPRLVIASTRTEDGISSLLNTIKSKPKDPEYVKLTQDLFARPISGHMYRGYLVLDEEIKQETEYYQGSKRPIWFVYSGMGSQWVGMGRDLMRLPIFANVVQKCHEILKPKGVDLIKILTDTSDPNLFDNILNSFVGIAAVQIGLTEILRAIGIVPDGIIGHSVGELGCAYMDGCVTAEQMILAAYSRGEASNQAKLIKGMMAAVGVGYNQIKDKLPPTIEVACHNGPDSSTISGPTEDMEVFVKQLQSEGIFARLVNVANIAYHSRYIKPAAPALLQSLKDIIPNPLPRSKKWISTSVPESNWDSDLAKLSSAEYHTNNLLNAVLFEEGLTHIPKESILIEIAPHGLLQAILKRSVKSGCINVPLTQRGNKNSVGFLLSALGRLYLAGLDLNLSPIYPPIEYPVSRATPGLAELVHWEHSEIWRVGFEDKMVQLASVKDVHITLNSEDYRDCVGNQLDEKIILPVSSYLLTVMNILTSGRVASLKYIVFEDLQFKKTITVPRIGSVPIYAMVQKGSGVFEILLNDETVVSGKVSMPTEKSRADTFPIVPTEENIELSANDVYSEFYHRGHKYSGPFKSIKSLTLTEDGSVSVTQYNKKWTILLEAMIQQHLFPDGERKQNILIPKLIQKISLSFADLPTEKQDVEVTYDYSTGLVSTEGIQISGLISRPVPPEPSPLSFYSYQFEPFKTEYKTMEQVIYNAINIVLDNFELKSISAVTVNEIDSSESLAEDIKNLSKVFNEVDINVVKAADAKSVSVSPADPTLLIVNNVMSKELANTVAKSHAFLLARSDKNILDYLDIVEVAQYTVEGVSYSLVRKTQNETPIVVTIKADTLSSRDLSKSSAWITELKQSVANVQQKLVFLVTNLLPMEGLKNFIEELHAIPEFAFVRLLFIFDKKAPEVKVSDPFYKNIFKSDLILNVVENGTVGYYLPVPTVYQDNVESGHFSSNVVDQKTIKFLGVNLLDETIVKGKEPELGNIDYSGYNSQGKKVMGLARVDPDSHKLITDPILTWVLPDEHNLDDLATMPHAYTSAYIALFMKGRLEHGETVLIHRGCSAIGLAAISMAGAHKCAVYTTVATEAQRAYLKNRFSFLKDRNILSSNDDSFATKLLTATGGLGAEVVVNSLHGTLLDASLRCVAIFGRFIQIGKFDCEENNTIGMKVFLKNTSFYGVLLEEVFELSSEEKQEIKDFVLQGIKDHFTRPLPRNIVEDQNIEGILQKLNKESSIGSFIIKLSDNIALNQFNVTKPNQFICNSKNSYLICGGSAEQWADMTEWLVLRGARKIVISSDSKPQQTHLNRRLTLLQTYFNTEIIFAPNKSQTRDGATELLSEIYLLGPIHAVFMLPNKTSTSKVSDSKAFQYIDAALRTTAPKALFVNFISSATGNCVQRMNAGFNTCNVQWHKGLDFIDAMHALDDILAYRIKNMFIKSDKTGTSDAESAQAIFKKLQFLVPTSTDELRNDIRRAPAKPELLQIPSLGPSYIRELPPVFIVPGLMNTNVIKELANQLLYPTFCALLPNTAMSLQDMATELAKEFKRVYPRGPFNIIGVSWGGALALEIARVLEKEGSRTLVLLIDGAPDTIQTALSLMGEGVSAELYILSKIFNISNSEVIGQLKSQPNWESRVKVALTLRNNKTEDEEIVKTILEVIKDRFKIIKEYAPSEQLISGDVYLLRPSGSSKYDNCGLLKYCKQTAKIHVLPGDHYSIIKSKEATDILNEKITTVC